MTLHDVYLLSPEIALAGVAVALLLLDLVVEKKRLITFLGVLGLLVPAGFVAALWVDLSNDGFEAVGVFDTLSVDRFSLFFKTLFLGFAGVVMLASTDYVSRFQRFQIEFYALLLLSTTGMMLLASTLELMSIYVALELTALPLAALAAFLRDSRSSEAGIKFLVLSAISSAVLLYGMVIIYGFTGATMLGEIALQIGQMDLSSSEPFGSYALLLGILLIVAGFGFKLSIVPFHMWVPDVYEGAPTPVTAFLSVASKAAAFAVVLRVFYVAFSIEELSIDWRALFAILSVLSMTLGNVAAIAQSNIKRLLAYSTIAHAGFLLMGLAAIAESSGDNGPGSVLFYLAAYGATNLAAFFTIIAFSHRTGSDMIDDFAGMGRRAPFLALVLALSMISLIGLPPTAVFIAKVYIIGAAVQGNLEWLAVMGVLNSVISAYYYMRVVKVLYLSPALSEEKILVGPPVRLAVGATALAVIFFGVAPSPLLEFARDASSILFS